METTGLIAQSKWTLSVSQSPSTDLQVKYPLHYSFYDSLSAFLMQIFVLNNHVPWLKQSTEKERGEFYLYMQSLLSVYELRVEVKL